MQRMLKEVTMPTIFAGLTAVSLLVGALVSPPPTRVASDFSVLTSRALLETYSSKGSNTASERPAKWKLLTDYPGRVREVTETQKREIAQFLSQNPNAEKFVCVGLGLAGQSAGMKTAVRVRAKLVCEYAKALKPELIVWHKSSQTINPGNNGRVLTALK
jgi:hypothetical protein